MNPFSLIFSFAAAFGLALPLTYFVRGWAVAVGLVDVPDGGRHAHENAVPRVGGIAVFLSLAAVVLLYVIWRRHELSVTEELRPLIVLMAGGAGIFGTGLWDDTRGMAARTKLLLQTVVAVLVFWAGIRIGGITIPGDGTLSLPAWLSLGLTVLWLVGITNAFNLIDGSDGVAAGAALFASVTTAVVSLFAGHEVAAVVSLAVAGATLGFLFFNFPPASIFLGDCGSLVLGFTLAGLGVVSTQKAPTALAVIIPVLAFGVPILDTLLVVVRRFLRREPIFHGDRGHIHHRLRELGMSPRRVALLLYGLCACFAALSLALVESTASAALVVPVVTGAVVWIIFQRLRVPELLELQRVLERGLAQRRVIANNVRIRTATLRVQVAEDADELLCALAYAFGAGEFGRVDVWVSIEYGSVLLQAKGVERRGAGLIWSCAVDGSAHEQLWQIQLPFRTRDGSSARQLGHIGLWGRTDSGHLLSDVRLIGLLLLPAFQNRLERLSRAGQIGIARARRVELVPARPLGGSVESN